MPKYFPPSVRGGSFNCPRCGAHADQKWFSVYVRPLGDGELPVVRNSEDIDGHLDSLEIPAEAKVGLRKHMEKQAGGDIYLTEQNEYCPFWIDNLHVSKCYSCNQISVWQYDNLIIPNSLGGPEANEDLPENVRRDYDEASSILDLSPRGSAALLRLCIQKLCIFLELPGKNLNEDIGKLVERGLNSKIQQALDIVRVIGNNAVHPGQIDLSDDKNTATELFSLVNLIVETMISQPKHVDAMYKNLPESALKGTSKNTPSEL